MTETTVRVALDAQASFDAAIKVLQEGQFRMDPLTGSETVAQGRSWRWFRGMQSVRLEVVSCPGGSDIRLDVSPTWPFYNSLWYGWNRQIHRDLLAKIQAEAKAARPTSDVDRAGFVCRTCGTKFSPDGSLRTPCPFCGAGAG